MSESNNNFKDCRRTVTLSFRLTRAEWFIDHGFNIFPIDPETKKPVITGWQKYSTTPLTEEEKQKFLEMIQKEGYNYAVPAGQRNLVILDFEDKELLKNWIGETALNELCKEKTLCVETPHGGLHIYLIVDEVPPHKFNPVFTLNGRGIADLQSYNSYVVGPVSCLNHRYCTSDKCKWRGQNKISYYIPTTPISNSKIGELKGFKDFLKWLAEKGKKLGIELTPNARAWIEGKKESDSHTEKDLEKLKEEMAKYDKYKGKTVDAVREEVCKEMKKRNEALKGRNDKEAEKLKAIYSIAIPVVCEGKTYNDLGIDRSRGDWNVFRALFIHGVTNLDVVYELLPSDAKVFAPKWDQYAIHTITKAWKYSKPALRYIKEVQGKNEKERKKIAQSIITTALLEKYKVKTFYQITGHNQAILGIFRWDGKKGIFVPFDKGIRKEIRLLAELFEISSLESILTRLAKREVDDIVDEVKDLTLTPLPKEPLRVAFKNVTIEWVDKGIKLYEKRTMKNYSFYYLPWEVNVEEIRKLADKETITVEDVEGLAKRLCPRALETFKAWADEKWILLYQIIGYTFYPAYRFRKAFMLIGSGKNGKSTYINLIKRILGDYAVSISPRELFDAKNRFVVANLYHKLANAVAESKDYSIDDMDRVKRLTGDDWITADVKFKDPITFKNVAKLIIASNNMPHLKDTNDKAFWHRWIIIEFPHQFKDNDAWFEKTFTEQEINGIVTTAIVALLRAFKQEHFDYEQTEEQVMDIWLSHIDSVYSFIKTYQQKGYITLDPTNGDLWVPRKVLYSLYHEYCVSQGFKGVSKKTFTRKLREYFNITVSQKGENKQYAYVGIAINKPVEELLPPKQDTGGLVNKFEDCLGFTLGAMSHDLLTQDVITEEQLMKYFKGQVNVVEKVEECLKQVGYNYTNGKFVKGKVIQWTNN